MAKIYSPNKNYTGVSATVRFVNGVGETENEHLINWFESKGYKVEESENLNPPDNSPNNTDPVVKTFEEMSIDELKAYAAKRNIDIGKASTEEGIIKKIEEAQKVE